MSCNLLLPFVTARTGAHSFFQEFHQHEPVASHEMSWCMKYPYSSEIEKVAEPMLSAWSMQLGAPSVLRTASGTKQDWFCRDHPKEPIICGLLHSEMGQNALYCDFLEWKGVSAYFMQPAQWKSNGCRPIVISDKKARHDDRERYAHSLHSSDKLAYVKMRQPWQNDWCWLKESWLSNTQWYYSHSKGWFWWMSQCSALQAPRLCAQQNCLEME